MIRLRIELMSKSRIGKNPKNVVIFVRIIAALGSCLNRITFSTNQQAALKNFITSWISSGLGLLIAISVNNLWSDSTFRPIIIAAT
jgi:hypothetical protein